MPYSSDEGKAWMLRQLRATGPRSVVDIGVGSGTYGRMAALELDEPPYLTGIEIHAPYVQQFGLHQWYDEVRVADVRLMPIPEADVVILGDVLEHMKTVDALAVWACARWAARVRVLLSLPIIEWPQDAVDGNEHERHVETWTHERVLAELEGIDEFEVGEQVGVYAARPARLRTLA
jgi:predicted TPR repeat methyltransferase